MDVLRFRICWSLGGIDDGGELDGHRNVKVCFTGTALDDVLQLPGALVDAVVKASRLFGLGFWSAAGRAPRRVAEIVARLAEVWSVAAAAEALARLRHVRLTSVDCSDVVEFAELLGWLARLCGADDAGRHLRRLDLASCSLSVDSAVALARSDVV